MENHISLIGFYVSNCCDTDAGTEDFLCAKNNQKSLFGSCSYLSNRSRTPELLSHIIHQTRHRNVFVVLSFNPVPEPLRSAYSLGGYGRLSRAESLPIVNLLFSVHAERLSTPVMPQNSFVEEKKVTLTRTVNSSPVPAATDWSCLMVAVGESACVENWSWQNKENLWETWQLSLLDPFKDAKLNPPPFQSDKFSTWLLIIFPQPLCMQSAVCSSYIHRWLIVSVHRGLRVSVYLPSYTKFKIKWSPRRSWQRCSKCFCFHAASWNSHVIWSRRRDEGILILPIADSKTAGSIKLISVLKFVSQSFSISTSMYPRWGGDCT